MVQSKKNSTAGFFSYADAFAYNTAGAITKMQLGNGKWETFKYNDRQQVTQIGLGTTDANINPNLLKLEFGYGNASQNNGSMLEQKITVPVVGSNPGFTAIQTYTYDSLNRIQSATETVNASQTWKETFTIDRYGNRRYDAANTTTIGSCASAVCNPTIATSNNRFTSGQGYTYDANGNVTQDATLQRFTYDAENHQKEFFAASNPGGTPDWTYAYDGDGRRVKKSSATETTVFVYDAGGTVIAEYATALAAVQQVSYLTTDHLGSPRATTDQNGAVTNRKDFTAFGTEVLSSQRVAGTNGNAYEPSSPTRKDYTGYEKDTESGLEFAQARYFSPTHGRFTSVDPLTASASIRDPQTFNRYTYVLNAPHTFVDPLGLLPSTGIACGACGNENLYVDGSAFRGKDTSFDWAFEYFGEVVGYSLGQTDNLATKRVSDQGLVKIDQSLAPTFTDTGIVIGASSFVNSISEHFQLKDGKLHTIHVFGDEEGNASAGVYIPKEFSSVTVTSKDTVIARNPKTGEVILIAHVKVGSGKKAEAAVAANMKKVRANGTVYIGQIGGKGGETPRGIHAHLSFFPSESSRIVAYNYKRGLQRTFPLADYSSEIRQHLSDFRRFAKR